MLMSCALILLMGLFFGEIFKKIKLPPLIGMLLVGILLGPSVFNLIDDSILAISADIRKIALVIILTRAGFNLQVNDLKKVGRSAFLMCFVPACFEILGMVLLAPLFLDLNLIDSLILGSVVAAVSPAVVVPKMVKLIDENKGCDKSIPQLILAGASVDDVFVIALFTSFSSLATENTFSMTALLDVPISIVTGILGGILLGFLFGSFLKRIQITSVMKSSIVLGGSLLLVSIENSLPFAFASLIGIMSMAMTLQRKDEQDAKMISMTYSKLWSIGEIFLFVLVGISVNMDYSMNLGLAPVFLIMGVLLFRMVGVLLCLIQSNLNIKERIFCMFAYMPKATVQAAIGGLPMAMGLACGETVLTVAVVSILFTAPLGAILMDATYQKYLN